MRVLVDVGDGVEAPHGFYWRVRVEGVCGRELRGEDPDGA